MAVMSKMRDYTKVFLVILVFAFVGTIIFDWGMQYTGRSRQTVGIIAVINGQEVRYDTFYDAYSQQIEAFRKQTGQDEIDENQLQRIEEQVWDQLVQQTLVAQVIKKEGIRAEDKEIVFHILQDPPSWIRSQPVFAGENGQFDFDKYNTILHQQPQEFVQVEQILRSQIPFEKLQGMITEGVRVTSNEVRERFMQENEKVTVQYLFFDPRKYAGKETEADEKELKQYYEDHKEDFREKEKRKLDYVLYEKSVNSEDSVKVQTLAEDIIEQLREGEDFAILAETYSADPGTASKGGDLGFFKRKTMQRPFEEAAFAAKVGEIVGPVNTRYGVHIIKVEERRGRGDDEEVKARHILLKYEISPSRMEKLREDAAYFAQRMKDGDDFEAVAQSENKEVKNTNFFSRTGFIPGIGLNSKVSRFAFASTIGHSSDAIETSRGIYVFRLADIKEEHIRPLDEVKNRITAKLKNEQRRARARGACEEVHAKLTPKSSLADVAAADSLELTETKAFARRDRVDGVGRDLKFIGRSFGLAEGAISTPVEGTRGWYLIQMLKRTQPDSVDFTSQQARLREELLRERRQAALTNWFASLRDQAEIEDYRDQILSN